MRDRVTEIKTIDIDNTCVDNPVYLSWVDATGGRNYWLFGKTHRIGFVVEGGQIFNKVVTDVENATSNSEYLSKDSNERWICGANNVPTEKMLGIETLTRAPLVEWLSNPDTWQEEGPKWQTVKVQPGTFNTREASASRHSIEITIDFPYEYLQSQ